MKASIAVINNRGRMIESRGEALPLYSITKTYIAAIIAAMNISVRERISSWFDRSLVPRGADITVEQLLLHQSGIPDYGNLSSYAGTVQKGGSAWSDETFADCTLRQPLLFEPGAGWSYSNPGYWLLSRIAQEETGLDFDGLVRRYITGPLGLNGTYVARGIFDDSLPDYRAEWVWHGLLIAPAEEVARFLSSELILPLSAAGPIFLRHDGGSIMPFAAGKRF